MRVRAVIVIGSVLIALGVAGCGGGTSTVSVPPTSPSQSASGATTATAAGTTTVAPRTGTARVPKPAPTTPVSAASFRADLTIQRAGLGLLALTNTTTNSITVRGWPTLVFCNAANESVPVPTKKVDIPGPGPSISIGPGETAFAGIEWVAGAKADPKTVVATSIRLTPPGYGGSINVNIIGVDGETDADTEFDLTSVQIGTLQPSSQGVLVF